jgi:hypothetical protein
MLQRVSYPAARSGLKTRGHDTSRSSAATRSEPMITSTLDVDRLAGGRYLGVLTSGWSRGR